MSAGLLTFGFLTLLTAGRYGVLLFPVEVVDREHESHFGAFGGHGVLVSEEYRIVTALGEGGIYYCGGPVPGGDHGTLQVGFIHLAGSVPALEHAGPGEYPLHFGHGLFGHAIEDQVLQPWDLPSALHPAAG